MMVSVHDFVFKPEKRFFSAIESKVANLAPLMVELGFCQQKSFEKEMIQSHKGSLFNGERKGERSFAEGVLIIVRDKCTDVTWNLGLANLFVIRRANKDPCAKAAHAREEKKKNIKILFIKRLYNHLNVLFHFIWVCVEAQSKAVKRKLAVYAYEQALFVGFASVSYYMASIEHFPLTSLEENSSSLVSSPSFLLLI